MSGAAPDPLDLLSELLDAPVGVVRHDVLDWVYAYGPALVEIARAALEQDKLTPFTPEWYRARSVFRAALARLDNQHG